MDPTENLGPVPNLYFWHISHYTEHFAVLTLCYLYYSNVTIYVCVCSRECYNVSETTFES